MTQSPDQEAFRILQNVLLAEIASENKSIQEKINDLKTCRKMLEEVHVCIGEEVHCYSILEGDIGPDKAMQQSGKRNQGSTSLGNVITFTMDRFKVSTFTLESFQIPDLICKIPIVACVQYARSFCIINYDV